MRGGRPSEYDPAICAILDGMGHEGEGMAEAIVACGISRDTFYRWQDIHPDFSDAVKAMKARSQAWWEEKGRKATFKNEGFNATSFIFNMKNRFKDDWSDVSRSELTGKDGGAIKTEGDGITALKALVASIGERNRDAGDTPAE